MDTLEILEDVTDEVDGVYDKVDWEKTLLNIQEWVKAYYDAIAKKEVDPEKYLNEVLPAYWQTVRAHNIYRWGKDHLLIDECYNVGIFLVGFSSLPIALSIAEIQPRQEIHFIHSDDTFERCDEITDRIVEMLEDPPSDFPQLITREDAASLIKRVQCATRHKIKDPSNPVSTFQEIKSIIDDVRGCLGDDIQIALDLTGGKKTMIGGGFTAGSIYSISPRCDMFYVDSFEYDQRRGAPKPGTEFLSQLENPYNVYNVQSVAQAKELYEVHNYEAAEGLWKRVRKKLDRHAGRSHFLVNEWQEAREYYGGSHCYRPWDALDYEEAVTRKTYCADAETYFWGYKVRHVHNSIDVLDILDKVTDKSNLFAQEQRVIHYAVDRYQNGIRRIESGKFEDALVRFTQVVEILCNYQIYRLGQDRDLIENSSSEPITDSLLPGQKWEIKPLITILFGYRLLELGGRQYKISESKKMKVNDYGYKNADQMTKLIQPRNDFIHFNKAMREKKTKRDVGNLQRLARKFLENFSKVYRYKNDLSFERLLELHQFRWTSLSFVERLVEELAWFSDSQIHQEHAIQIYNEKLQSVEGNAQQRIAQALKDYWQRIGKWENGISDKQRKKVLKVTSILQDD